MYDTYNEANQKLSGTIVLYKNLPVWITEAEGQDKNVQLYFKELRTSRGNKACIWDKDWEFRNLGPRIGYANFDLGKGSYKEALYIQRMGVRQAHNTQGLSSKNLKMPNFKGNSKLSLPMTVAKFSNLYDKSGFLDMLEQKYPSLAQVATRFLKDPEVTSMAFNRQFGVRSHPVGPYYLTYRGKDIGYSDDFYKWKVSDPFKYLSETLDYLNLKTA